MSSSYPSETPAVVASDGGKAAANLNYILYIVGFFTGITAIVGVILAYQNRREATEPYRSHFEYQIKMFWRGLIFWAAIIGIYIVAGIVSTASAVATVGSYGMAASGSYAGAIAAVPSTGGILVGIALLFVPAGVGIYWLVTTILRIVKGMGALGKGQMV